MSFDVPEPAPPAAQAVCYRHPDRLTALACSNCGRPICPACSTDAAVGQRCPECLRGQGRQQVIPVGRTRPRSAPVTSGIIALTVAVAAVAFVAPRTWEAVAGRLQMDNSALAAGEWWRMMTVVLLHAGLTHLLFNMLALFNLGPQIEREVGPARFLALYLASAAAGSAFAFHLGGPFDLGVGASGAIFGLFGVWLAAAVRRRNTAYGRYLLGQLGFVLAINAAFPLLIPNVSWQAHLGGLVSGFVLGWVWGELRGARRRELQLVSALAFLVLAVGSVLLL
jgi:membrane associated rhomboid family serine protease